MNGRHHFYAGIATALSLHIIMTTWAGADLPLWVAILGATTGAALPDWDLMAGNMAFHRHALTHSAVIPATITLWYFLDGTLTVGGGGGGACTAMPYLLAALSLGAASHLVLDCFYEKVPKQYRHSLRARWRYRLHILLVVRRAPGRLSTAPLSHQRWGARNGARPLRHYALNAIALALLATITITITI